MTQKGVLMQAWKGLLCGAMCGLLGACHSATAPTNGDSGAVQDKAPETLAEVNRLMVVAVPTDKDSTPVELRFDLPAVPVQGQPFDIHLALLPQALAASMVVNLEARDGLDVQDPRQPTDLGKVQSGTVRHLTARLVAAATGTRILRVHVTLDLPTGSETRAFECPVVVLPAATR